jgi:Cu-Zn family superoxide dismutase
MNPSFDKAVAVIHAINDSEVSGVAYFEKVEDGVHVRAEVTGLTGEKHGFHIHTFGDCTAEDGTSTGGHFNPDGMDHGSPDMMDRHMGAMGNLEVNEEGVGIRDYIDKVIDMDKIIGRGIIVHGGEDDLVSQPSGASGPRIGCGVIGIQQ